MKGRTLQETAHERAENLPSVALEHPFGPDWEVYKVGGKVFMLMTDVPRHSRVRDGRVVAGQPVVIVKADPSDAAALRQAHADITPGYHLNKRHWITLGPGGSLTKKRVEELVTDSYRIVLEALPRTRRPVPPEAVGS
ncbi:MmcQ/YjbR family DNA-binding protein [Salinifilum aidingensis]